MLNNALQDDTYNNDGKSKDFRCLSRDLSFGGTYKMVKFVIDKSCKTEFYKRKHKVLYYKQYSKAMVFNIFTIPIL